MPDKIMREQFEGDLLELAYPCSDKDKQKARDRIRAYADQQNALYATSMSKAVAEKLKAQIHERFNCFVRNEYLRGLNDIIDTLTEEER